MPLSAVSQLNLDQIEWLKKSGMIIDEDGSFTLPERQKEGRIANWSFSKVGEDLFEIRDNAGQLVIQFDGEGSRLYLNKELQTSYREGVRYSDYLLFPKERNESQEVKSKFGTEKTFR